MFSKFLRRDLVITITYSIFLKDIINKSCSITLALVYTNNLF